MNRRRQLQRLAQRYGFELGQTRKSHFRLRHPNGQVVVASFTPSDGNDLHHVLKGCLRRVLRSERHAGGR